MPRVQLLFILLLTLLAAPAEGAEFIRVDLREKRMSADVDGWGLERTLTRIVTMTGWEVYIEPDTGLTRPASEKFKNVPVGRALARLLPGINFSFVSSSTGATRLLLFTTSAGKATKAMKIKTSRLKKQIVVQLKPNSKRSIDEIAKDLGAKVVGRIKDLNTYRLEFPYDNAALLGRDALLRDDDVLGVDFNYTIEGPRGSASINRDTATISIRPGSGPAKDRTIVALIDTPVQANVANSGFLLDPISVTGQPRPAGNEPTHGTSMFQTLLRGLDAGTGTATESNVRVLPIDIYGSAGETSTFNVAQGLAIAVEKGASIVNLSLGSDTDSPMLRSMIEQASNLGVTIIASAGNEPITDNVYPAAYPDVVAVTAGNRTGDIAEYANRGDFVDVVGPGRSVVSHGEGNYVITGTSPASAFVAGVAAGLANTTGADPAAIQAGLKLEFAPNPSGR
ncbi:MAG: S8 family peptidase [Limisphaerales bacterium]